MGVLDHSLEMMRRIPLQPGFEVVELGDQYITQGERRLASDFYRELGCGRYECIEGNGRGSILADLNEPLDPHPGRFDLVTDFGTGEHVFDQRQVFETTHSLIGPGGWWVFDRPSQGYPGHCYWLADECVWRDVAEWNEYEIWELETSRTKRGELIRGVFRRTTQAEVPFRVPQQGRYRKLLRPIISEPPPPRREPSRAGE